MLLTHPDPERHTNRIIAAHGHRKPDRALVIALIKMRLIELPPNSLRRQALEQMIRRTLDRPRHPHVSRNLIYHRFM